MDDAEVYIRVERVRVDALNCLSLSLERRNAPESHPTTSTVSPRTARRESHECPLLCVEMSVCSSRSPCRVSPPADLSTKVFVSLSPLRLARRLAERTATALIVRARCRPSASAASVAEVDQSIKSSQHHYPDQDASTIPFKMPTPSTSLDLLTLTVSDGRHLCMILNSSNSFVERLMRSNEKLGGGRRDDRMNGRGKRHRPCRLDRSRRSSSRSGRRGRREEGRRRRRRSENTCAR